MIYALLALTVASLAIALYCLFNYKSLKNLLIKVTANVAAECANLKTSVEDIDDACAQHIRISGEDIRDLKLRLDEVMPTIKEINKDTEDMNKKYNEGLENIFNYKVASGIKTHEDN